MNEDSGYDVYILTCADGTLYTGIARDARKRLARHNAGKGAKYTRSRVPCELSYLEKSPSRAEASKREYALKKLTREAKLRLIEVYNEKGIDANLEGGPYMADLLEFLKARYSERRFDPEKQVTKEDLEKILEAARVAPTAHNSQPFRIHVLGEQFSRDQIKTFSHCYFKAPLHILLSAADEESWVRDADGFAAAELDIGIVGTQMVLEAESLGLKSCMICAFDPEACREAVGLSTSLRPIMILAIGYPSDKSKAGPLHEKRKSLEDLCEYKA